MQRELVENCFFITPKRVNQSLDRIGRKIGDYSDYKRADICYKYDKEGEEYFIIVTVGENSPQKIATETIGTPFGEKEYFRCENCDSRCSKLFLLPMGHTFCCRKCHMLRYQNFNTSSEHGKLFDMSRKVIKLMNQQENMTSRRWYRNAYTKRYNKFLDNCLKTGLKELVEIAENARAVESVVKGNIDK